jgi:transcriptional regulator with XRE-family HTH domain
MAKTSRSLSPTTLEATRLLGTYIRLARRERRWTSRDLAERIGVSLPTLLRIEQGDPTVSLGTAFEAATILGVPLFDQDASRRRVEMARVEDRLALLPKTVRKTARIDNDF